MTPEELPERDLLECVAEEAGELVQACMKYIRAIEPDNKNYTPVPPEEAHGKLVEEVADTLLSITVMCRGLGISENGIDVIQNEKYTRWVKRLSR